MATEPRLQSWFRAAQQQSESIKVETPAYGDRHEQAHPRSPCASRHRAANPVGFTLSCNVPAGQLTCSGQVSLPAGKRVVLENVSARVHAPSGQTVQLYVSTSSGNLPSGSIAARNYVVLTPTNSGTFYFANQQLRMYSIIGASVSIQGQRISYSQGAPGSVDYEVWFTGYLLP
jgi:hypothetical protein